MNLNIFTSSETSFANKITRESPSMEEEAKWTPIRDMRVRSTKPILRNDHEFTNMEHFFGLMRMSEKLIFLLIPMPISQIK